jgi:hypothetical protein
MVELATREQKRQLHSLRKQEWQLTRELAMQSTYAMANLVLWPNTPQSGLYEPLHKPLADFIDQAKPGARKMVIVPRGHRKTYLLTYAHTVRRIVCDPNVRILIVTALDRTAKKMMGILKKQFTDNKSFAEFFPEFVFDASIGTQYDFVHPLRTIIEQNPTACTTYTGAPLIGCRADIIICDDAVSEDKVANPELADKNNTHLNELVPILDINPRYDMMFVVGTPKSYNDYYAIGSGQATSNDGEAPTPVFEHVRRASLESDGQPDMKGEPILPTIFTREKLMQIREQCASNQAQGEGYFYREYQTMVQAPQDQKFLDIWFNTWIDQQMMPPTVFSAMCVDTALKDEQILFKGDNMVILVGHVDYLGRLYLTDGARSRAWRTEEFRKVLLSMADNPKNLGVQNFVKEKIGEGTMFPMVRGWFNDARKPVIMHPLKVIGQGKKYLRITEALQGPAMARKIFFVKGLFPEDLHKVIVDELTHLGQWGHDDAADALALFFHPDIRIIPPTGKSGIWKDVVSPPSQISTAWTNPVALAHGQAQVETNSRDGRLTPFGEDIDLRLDTFMEGKGPSEMPSEIEWQPVIQKDGRDPFGNRQY